MWLNGPTQWEDHKLGKKHRKGIKQKPGLFKAVKKSWAEFKGKTDRLKSKKVLCMRYTSEDRGQRRVAVTHMAGEDLAIVLLDIREPSNVFVERVAAAVGLQEHLIDGTEVLITLVLPSGKRLVADEKVTMGFVLGGQD